MKVTVRRTTSPTDELWWRQLDFESFGRCPLELVTQRADCINRPCWAHCPLARARQT